jgi:hypothetical protein
VGVTLAWIGAHFSDSNGPGWWRGRDGAIQHFFKFLKDNFRKVFYGTLNQVAQRGQQAVRHQDRYFMRVKPRKAAASSGFIIAGRCRMLRNRSRCRNFSRRSRSIFCCLKMLRCLTCFVKWRNSNHSPRVVPRSKGMAGGEKVKAGTEAASGLF